MKIFVPFKKDAAFASEVLTVMSDQMAELKEETGKWPDKMWFIGAIGNELLQFIIDSKWDISAFGPQGHPVSLPNKIRFEYTKHIDQIEDVGQTIFDEALNGRMINGILGEATKEKIASAYSGLAYTIERKINPFREVRLIRRP